MSGDHQYCGIPWKDGGRTRAGVDCAGMAMLWLAEQRGQTFPELKTDEASDAESVLQQYCKAGELERGDVEFFRVKKSGKVRHVAIYLGDDKRLHIFGGVESRIETGLTLMRRLGLEKVGAISWRESAALARALGDARLRDPVTWVMIAISAVLSLVSYLLTPSLSSFKNRSGRYGSEALLTQKNPELPLPDLLGSVVVAGNAIYQQLPDKNAAVDDDPKQKWNQIIVLASGPVELLDYYAGLQIKGVTWSDKSFNDNTNTKGIVINPAQTKAEAVTGTISGDSNVPSVSLYEGTHGISVPVDVRAQYDRGFPLYGLSGCSYLVFRMIDSSKFSNFNVTCRVKGRKCRAFDENGFVQTTVTSEAVGTGDSTTRRWKLDFEDIASVASVTVNGSGWTEISASNQTGNVYYINALKGYIEFPDNIPGAHAIVATYDYYPREWTDNPAAQMVYLLTEPIRGKGFAASKLDWESFNDAQEYFDETVDWVNSAGASTAARFVANYAVDYRKPVQEHLRALLDACRAALFLSGGKLYLRPRVTSASVFSFNSTNILVDENGESTFEAEQMDRANKPNRIKAFFHSEDSLNAETEVAVDDEVNQSERAARLGNFGIVEDSLKYPAVTSQAQAERIATAALIEQSGSNWLYRWKTNIKGLALQIGDIVDVTNEALPDYTAKLMRIEALEFDEMDRLAITASEVVAAADL